jgi:hypothetical protein
VAPKRSLDLLAMRQGLAGAFQSGPRLALDHLRVPTLRPRLLDPFFLRGILGRAFSAFLLKRFFLCGLFGLALGALLLSLFFRSGLFLGGGFLGLDLDTGGLG